MHDPKRIEGGGASQIWWIGRGVAGLSEFSRFWNGRCIENCNVITIDTLAIPDGKA